MSTIQKNPEIIDELSEEEFYLNPEWDILPPNRVILCINSSLQYGYRVMSPLKVSLSEFHVKHMDN